MASLVLAKSTTSEPNQTTFAPAFGLFAFLGFPRSIDESAGNGRVKQKLIKAGASRDGNSRPVINPIGLLARAIEGEKKGRREPPWPPIGYQPLAASSRLCSLVGRSFAQLYLFMVGPLKHKDVANHDNSNSHPLCSAFHLPTPRATSPPLSSFLYSPIKGDRVEKPARLGSIRHNTSDHLWPPSSLETSLAESVRVSPARETTRRELSGLLVTRLATCRLTMEPVVC